MRVVDGARRHALFIVPVLFLLLWLLWLLWSSASSKIDKEEWDFGTSRILQQQRELQFPKFDAYISTFVAADPAAQTWCAEVLRKGSSTLTKETDNGAQFDQDVFVFRNLFLAAMQQGRRGFYIEAGANDYKHLSTTYFYDKCLGWDGLCVEPQPQYHDKLRTERSCTLVPECLSKTEGTMFMDTGEAGLGDGGSAGTSSSQSQMKNMLEVRCRPLDVILAEHGRTHVDLFVLDVEGAERLVLESVNWDKLSFGAWLIEDNKLNNRNLDYFMTERGFVKYEQLAIDSLFVNISSGLLQSMEPKWYPSTWPRWEELCEMKSENC